jgi:hypothetical protein
MAFNYGPFAPNEKVIVYHEIDNEWYIATVVEMSDDGKEVCVEDGEILRDVKVSECFPAYHSDINLVVKKYQKVVAKEKQLYEQLLKYFRETW